MTAASRWKQWAADQWLDLVVMAAVGGAFLFTVAAVVPWHMDEFLGYHHLACKWYPGNMANTFRSSCTELGLAPWGGTMLPLRSYTYSGSLPGLLYLPIFALWPSPLSARLLGILAIAAQSLLLHRVFGVRPAVNFFVLLSFLSYSAIQVFDLGPICLQLTLQVAIYCVLRRWRASAAARLRYQALYPLAIGLMAFIGVWNKVAFFFVVPSLALLVVALTFDPATAPTAPTATPTGTPTGSRPALRRLAAGAVGAAAFAVPTLALLFSKTAAGLPYHSVITGAPVLFDYLAIKQRFTGVLLPFLINPLRSSHLIMRDPRPVTGTGLVLVGLIAATLVYGFVVARRRADGSSRRALWLVAGWVVSIALVALSAKSHAAHHVQLGLPFLILALYELLAPLSGRRLVCLLVVLFVLLNSLLYLQFVELRHEGITSRASRDLETMNDALNERFAERYLIVCIDWGFYYLKSLYGPPEQAVVHFWGLKRPAQLRAVQATADRLGRKLLFVGWDQGSRSDWKMIVGEIDGLREELPAWDGGRWRLAFEPAEASQ